MKHVLSLLVLATLGWGGIAAQLEAKTTPRDLVGHWEATIDFVKFKFKLSLNVDRDAKTGRIQATLNQPERGIRDMPIAAILLNAPDVRIEIDQFNTAFQGQLTEDGSAIDGRFEEGPGGRPMMARFVRRPATVPSPPLAFGYTPDEPKHARGYWRGRMEAMPGIFLELGLQIGQRPDGSLQALLDSFSQGARGVPSSKATPTPGRILIEWEGLSAEFNGALNTDASELAGSWKQGPRSMSATFRRENKPATLFPEGTRFTRDTGVPDDVLGVWKGTLAMGQQTLRLQFRIGRSPDGVLVGSLTSLDQGGTEMLLGAVTFTAPQVKIVAPMIRGSYTGQLNAAGDGFEGQWEQFGQPQPLSLRRETTAAPTAQP